MDGVYDLKWVEFSGQIPPPNTHTRVTILKFSPIGGLGLGHIPYLLVIQTLINDYLACILQYEERVDELLQSLKRMLQGMFTLKFF